MNNPADNFINLMCFTNALCNYVETTKACRKDKIGFCIVINGVTHTMSLSELVTELRKTQVKVLDDVGASDD